jgi:putative spermidine/putrescine transport system substrate-binding protein
MEELGQGSRAMVASTMGWDMNPRVLGTVPKDFQAAVLDETTLIADGHYAAIPKGLDERRRVVTQDLISFMLQPEQQAKTYDQAYFYPGPAVKGVTLEMAPQESQEAVESVSRPEFDRLIDSLPIETQLDAKSLVRAFELWDERVGGGKIKEEES